MVPPAPPQRLPLAPSTCSSAPGSAWPLFRSSCRILLSLPEAGRDLADESPRSRPFTRLGTALVLPGQAGARPWGTCSAGRWGSLSSGAGRPWVPRAGPEEPPAGTCTPVSLSFPSAGRGDRSRCLSEPPGSALCLQQLGGQQAHLCTPSGAQLQAPCQPGPCDGTLGREDATVEAEGMCQGDPGLQRLLPRRRAPLHPITIPVPVPGPWLQLGPLGQPLETLRLSPGSRCVPHTHTAVSLQPGRTPLTESQLSVGSPISAFRPVSLGTDPETPFPDGATPGTHLAAAPAAWGSSGPWERAFPAPGPPA